MPAIAPANPMITDPHNQALTLDALSLGLSNDSPEIRSKAAETIGHLSNVPIGEELRQKAVDCLVARLGDREPRVRAKVVEAIAKLSDESALPKLAAALADSEADVRNAAAEALGTIGSESAIAHLQALLGDRDPDVRATAARGLGKIGSETAIPALVGALKHQDPEVSSQAIDAILDALSALVPDSSPEPAKPKIEINYNAPVYSTTLDKGATLDKSLIGSGTDAQIHICRDVVDARPAARPDLTPEEIAATIQMFIDKLQSDRSEGTTVEDAAPDNGKQSS